MAKTKVAVITRTKNRPVFLSRAIQSVGAQTYGNYIQVIVNDGGSRQQVEEVVNELDEQKKSKIKLFHRTESSNAPDTIFNESIDKIDSEYVAIHDDDDTWHPEFLERTVKELDAGAKGIVVRTDKVVEKVSGKKVVRLKKAHYLPDVKAINLYRQCVDNQLTPIAFIYRRDVYKEVGKYDNSLPVVGDWEFGIRFLLKYDIKFLDPGFALANYHHRKNGQNSFTKHSHRDYFNIVANRYLRQELAQGKLGVGYIINQVRYEQSFMARTVNRLLPNFVTKRLKHRIYN